MSADIARLLVRIGADISDLKSGMAQGKAAVQSDTGAIRASIKEMAGSIVQEFRTAGGSVGAFAGVLGSLTGSGGKIPALVGFMREAVVGIAEFGQQMGNVAALMPGNTALVNQLSDSVRAMAVQYGASTKDLTAGLYEAVSAYGATKDAAKSLEIATKGAAAGQSTISEALAITSGMTKAWGDTSLAAQQHAMDLSLAVVRLGSTNLPQLSSAMGQVAPMAATLGISMEETAAYMATFSKVTGSTNQAATQMTQVMQGLLKPLPEMEAALKAIGQENGVVAMKTLGLTGTLKALSDSVDGDQVKMAALFGSSEALRLVFPAVGKSADTLAANLKSVQDVTGESNKAFDAQHEGLGRGMDQWNKFRAAIEEFANTIGEKVLGPLSDLLGIVTGIVNAMSSALGSTAAAKAMAAGTGAAVPARAGGGPLDHPGLYIGGEDGREIVVPTNSGHRSDGVKWWKQAGHELGIPGFQSGGSLGGMSTGGLALPSDFMASGAQDPSAPDAREAERFALMQKAANLTIIEAWSQILGATWSGLGPALQDEALSSAVTAGRMIKLAGGGRAGGIGQDGRTSGGNGGESPADANAGPLGSISFGGNTWQGHLIQAIKDIAGASEKRALQNQDLSDPGKVKGFEWLGELDAWSKDFISKNEYEHGQAKRDQADADKQAAYDRSNTGNSRTTTRGDRWIENTDLGPGGDTRTTEQVNTQREAATAARAKELADVDAYLASVPQRTETIINSLSDVTKALRMDYNLTGEKLRALAPDVENLGAIMKGVSQMNGAATGPIWNGSVLHAFTQLQDSTINLTQDLQALATGTNVGAMAMQDMAAKTSAAGAGMAFNVNLFGQTASVLTATVAGLTQGNPYARGPFGSQGSGSALSDVPGVSGRDLALNPQSWGAGNTTPSGHSAWSQWAGSMGGGRSILEQQQWMADHHAGQDLMTNPQAWQPGWTGAGGSNPDLGLSGMANGSGGRPQPISVNNSIYLDRDVLYREMKLAEAEDQRSNTYTTGRGRS